MSIQPFLLHLDTALTNVSVQYRNADLVSGIIMPTIPVLKQSDKYFVYTKDNLRAVDDQVRPLAQTNQIVMGRSANGYYCDGHGLKYPIADEDRGNDDLGSYEIDATIALTDQILLNREVACLAAIQSGITNIVDLSASGGANQWSNDNFDPIKYIDAQKIAVAKVIGKKPNTLVLSTPTLSGLRNNALVKSRISGAPSLDSSHITLQQLAAVLELDRVVEAAAVKQTANLGQPDALDFVWGKSALLCYVPSVPGLRTISLGYHFMYNFPVSGGQLVGNLVQGGAGYGIRKWYEQKERATWIEALMYYSMAIVCPDAGVLYNNAVA